MRRSAERAAEDARGAAAGLDVRAGHLAARRAAADRALALPAAAVRAARARGCRAVLMRDHGYLRSRRARGRGGRRTAASARRSKAQPRSSSRRETRPRRLLERRGASTAIRGGGSTARKALGGRRQGRSGRAGAPAAARCRRCLRDLGCSASRADERVARERRSAAAARSGLLTAFDGDRAFARFRRSIGRWRRSIATPARRSSPTGWRSRL